MNAKKTLFVQAFLCLSIVPAFPIRMPSGTQAIASGTCRLFDQSAFAAANNPALMSKRKTTAIGFSVANLYTLRALKHLSIACIIPYKHSAYGLNIIQSGNTIYKLSQIGLSVSHTPSPSIYIGLRTTYNHFSIVSYGSKSQHGLDLAFQAKIHKNINSSMMVEGLLVRFQKTKDYNSIERLFAWGLQYRADKHIDVLIELEKTETNKSDMRIGLQYHTDSFFCLGMGLSGRYNEISSGITYSRKNAEVGLSFIVHPALGISSNISFIYEFKN